MNFRNLVGIIGGLLYFGRLGPLLRNNSGALEARNNANSAFAVFRVANPVGDNDAINLKYFTTSKGTVIIDDQVNTSSAFPDNTAVKRTLVVSTGGNGAVLGDILLDNGLNDSQPMEIVGKLEGRTIVIKDALSGGSAVFDPDSIYVWDEDGGSWVKSGDVGSVTGANRQIRMSVALVDKDSDTDILANSYVNKVAVAITTAYSAGATIKIGNSVDDDLLVLDSEIVAQATAGTTFLFDLDSAWGGSDLPLRATIGGAPSNGACVVRAFFGVPNA